MSEQTVAFDSATYRQTMGDFATGVVVVTGLVDEQPIGFAAQSFVSLSLDPVSYTHLTLPTILLV